MGQVLARKSSNTIQHHTRNFNALLKDPVDGFCKTGLYTLKSHLLGDVIEDLDWSGCLELLNSSAYERGSVHIRRAYRSTSQHRTSELEETLSAVEVNTISKRQKLHKTRMTMIRAVFEKTCSRLHYRAISCQGRL